ncbi:MAG: hypothetical protein JKY56_13580, partial [Kofleriaceae bacterium]|nr:hypothetical protein [Kofleriaceae bacterium]
MDTSSNLRTVRGAVVIRENGIGVPDLLIVVGLQTKESAISLGSCITDADGRYVLEYSHTTNLELAAWLRTLSAEIPDMLVAVNRDDPGSSGLATIASEIRRAPGISEVMSFRIAQADLDQAQVVLQDSPEAKDQLAARNAIYEVRTTDSMETERESNRLSFVRRMQEAKKGKQGTAEIRRALSVNSDDARYVHSESERVEKIEAAVRSSVKGRINPSRVTGRLSTEAAGEVGPDGLIDAGRVEVATSHRMPSGLIMRHKMPCVPRMPYDSCLAALYPTPPEPPVEPEEPPPGDVADPAPLLEEDISKAARRVLGGLLGDENITGKTRAGLAEVERSVEGFVLHSGPADTSSIHDFQQIQMAFEHVWEELLDEDLVSVGEDLYGQLVIAGLPPGDHLFDGEGDISSSHSTTTTIYSPPAYVQQAFDISFKEWTKIKQWKLDQELIYLAEHACYTWWEKTKGFMPALTAGHQREALKEGNRLIDNIRKR